MQDDIINAVMAEVRKRVETPNQETPVASVEQSVASICSADSLTEFVGTSEFGETLGLVIANLDQDIHTVMGFDKKYRSLGIIGARTGAGPQIMAADEAIKATNTEILKVELPRDTKGGAGHGCLIIFGAEDVSDARRAVEVTLDNVPKFFGDVYANDTGHLELQYTARASKCLTTVFGAPEGKAFGLILGAPAAIGMLMIDAAVKSADVEVLDYGSPAHGTSMSNEVFITVSGDSGAVRQAVIAGREVGKPLLSAWGQPCPPAHIPYI
jgi:bacterial microcompartment shell protein